MKRIIVSLLVGMLILPTAFAQRTTGAAVSSFDVTINTNVAGASITVDGAGIKGNVTNLKAGSHTVSASAPGYVAQSLTINVTKVETFTINLQPATASVTFSANVGGADIAVSGVSVKAQFNGKSPFTAQLLPGTYTVTAQAGGYRPITTQVNVSAGGAQTFSLSLEQLKIDVVLSCNVGGADVSVSGPASVSGKAPLAAQLPPGQYTVTMSAAGYRSNTAQVSVAAAPQKQAVSLTLEPSNATMNIVIPRNMLDPDSKDEGLLRGMVKVFVDGRLMNAKAEVMGSVPIAPGKHTIRIASGSLSFQQDFDFAAGGAYNLELVFGMQLKPAGK